MKPIWLTALGLVALVSAGNAAAQEKVDFAKQIKPILEGHCLKCHGPKSARGEFRLHTKELAFQGGATGEPGIVAGSPDESPLVDLVTLPADDPARMPKEADPLSKEQIDLLRRWVEEGAEWPEGEELLLPEDKLAKDDPLAGPGLPVTEAEKAAVAKLQEFGALALRIAQNTNWLRVDFSLSDKDVADADLATLKDAPNLVELDLGGTQVTDAGLEHIKGLGNLVLLHLERTKIAGPGLANLKDMPKLAYLNLYGTEVGDEAIEHLKGLKKLRKLYLWQTKVTDDGVKKLKEALPELYVNRGIEPPAEPKQEEVAKTEESKKEADAKEEPKKEEPEKKDESKKPD